MDRMSSNNAPANASANTTASSMTRNWPLIFSALITAGFFIGTFVSTSLALGTRNEWEWIKREVMTKVWPLTLIGTLCFFITSAIYILQDPHKTMYFLLVVCCLALGLSYSALVISVISK